MAIDYANDKVVVGARCHGNNVENFWEGNTVAANNGAYGFQNNFTGSSGNIHISWLGKLKTSDGALTNATYMAELAEGTSSLGSPHPDPNLDGWSNPNSGWPDVNSTRMAKSSMRVTNAGDVCVLATGRRTITTANAYQKMVKPYYGGLSCWNSFVRVYDSQFHVPKYSSLIIGAWDTLTQAGGDNTEMFGVYKTSLGVVCVGRQKASGGIPAGNNLPVTNVAPWGSATPQNESAVLVYYQATNLYNTDDDIPSALYWNGSVSDEWENPMNWNGNVLPNINSVVIVPSTAPHYPHVKVSTEIKSIELKPGSTIIVNPGVVVKVNGE